MKTRAFSRRDRTARSANRRNSSAVEGVSHVERLTNQEGVVKWGGVTTGAIAAARGAPALTFQGVQSHREAPSIWNAEVATPQRNFRNPARCPVRFCNTTPPRRAAGGRARPRPPHRIYTHPRVDDTIT